MPRREESETALPQKESRRERRCGHPRARTSVAVSERAQQNDLRIPYQYAFGIGYGILERTRSSSFRPFAALVK
jgi:hypothetical protein